MNNTLSVTVDNGMLQIDAAEIFEMLSDKQQTELIKWLAWDTPIWKEIKESVGNDFATPHYNPKIHKLRLAFLTSDGVDDTIRSVIKVLLNEIKRSEQRCSDYHKAYGELFRWVSDGCFGELPRADASDIEYTTDEQIKRFLEVAGITQAMLEKPLKTSEKEDGNV